MEVLETIDLACPPAKLFALVEDLGRYPDWLGIVSAAEPDPGPSASDREVAHVDDGAPSGSHRAAGTPAWDVELRGRIGPLARSKRLRMVRTTREAPWSVRFERVERDGRDHAPWVLDAAVQPTPIGSRLTMHLRYEGVFATSVLEGLLRDEIERSRPRLRALVEG